MIGYKTDTETVSWTLDDPLFSFDSGHPQKRRSYSSKILDSSTATATICIYMKIKIIIVVVPHKEVWDERSNLKTWSSPSTDIIMIVNTLTLANAWMLKHWPTQKPSSYSRLHTHIHTHTDTNVYSHDTTVLIIVHAHLPFIPGVHKLDLSSNIFTAGKLTYSIYALSFVDFPQIP